MSRIENRCFYASAVAHGVLLIAVVIGSAFYRPMEKFPEENLPLPLQMIAIDGRSRGGGNPDITEPPAPAAAAPAPSPNQPKIEEAPAPAAPTPKPPPIEKPVIKNAEIPLPAKAAKSPKAADKPPEKKIAIADTSKPVKRTNDKAKQKSTLTEDTDRQARQLAAARRDALNKITSSFGSSLSSPVNINVESPGPGGQAFWNYGQIIVGIYQKACGKPQDTLDENAVVQVTVTIARDGHVINARVAEPSGVTALDKLVRQTLDRVRQFPPFPEGATDSERTFNIDFKPKPTQSTG
jgi:protein TonB